MRSKGTDKLDLSCRVLVALSVVFIVLALPWSLQRGLIGLFSVSFYIALAFLAVQGALVLWSGRSNVRTWYGQVMKWTVIVGGLLALVLTLAYVATGTPITLAGFEVRSIERLIVVHSLEGSVVLFLTLWAFLMALTWFFAAALSGGIWLMAKAQRKYMPELLVELRSLTFDKRDPWPRRIAAWLLSFPNVLEPSSLRLEVQSLDARLSRRRLFRTVAWQMALGTILGVYVSLNPTLLSVLPFAETYALVSIPVGLIPLLILPLLTLEALGAKAPGPRTDFYLHVGAEHKVLQALLALGGLLWIIWWAVGKVGASRIVETFASYAVLLFLFSLLVSFIYLRFFEATLIDDIEARLEERGF